MVLSRDAGLSPSCAGAIHPPAAPLAQVLLRILHTSLPSNQQGQLEARDLSLVPLLIQADVTPSLPTERKGRQEWGEAVCFHPGNEICRNHVYQRNHAVLDPVSPKAFMDRFELRQSDSNEHNDVRGRPSPPFNLSRKRLDCQEDPVNAQWVRLSAVVRNVLSPHWGHNQIRRRMSECVSATWGHFLSGTFTPVLPRQTFTVSF
jgi:hypothetical protein